MIKRIIPILLCILTVSCKNSNDPEDWISKNKYYFNHMKDSTSYILYNIPEIEGGHSYYYTILAQGIQSDTILSDTTKVLINYRIRLISGAVVEETYSQNSVLNDSTAKPHWFYIYSLASSGVVKNIKQMKIGEIRRCVLPEELAFFTFTENYPQHSTLIIDTQLINIQN